MLEKKFNGFRKSSEKHLYLSTEPYFIEKDRASGEKDLETIVDTEKHEGCWLFVPAQNTWYNLVTERNTLARGNRLILEIKTEPLILNLDYCILHYHTHPKYCEKKIFATLEKAVKKKCGVSDLTELHNHAGLKRQLRNWTALYAGIPSVQDISSYIKVIKRNPNSNFYFKVASSHGIFTIKFGDMADIDSAVERYQIVHKKVFDVQRLPVMIGKIKKHMNRVFEVSMEYRLNKIL